MKLYEDPPPVISHPAHPAHKLTLVAGGGAPFVCDGCKDAGDGARYTCDRGDAFHLHTCCALAEEQAPVVHHPLFGDRAFVFLPEPPPPVDDTVCDACGEPARGFVYHCLEADLDLHPCCALLPERILRDGRVFELRREASRPCGMCGGRNGRRRRRFWAYRSYFDGEAVDLHVACMKDMARLGWEAGYHDRVGGGQIVPASAPILDGVLQRLPRNKRRSTGFQSLCKIVGAVVSVIISVIFGNPMAMIAAVAGPGGFLRD
ncbi:hypothetical protein ACP70R_047516 [Stipagrostis hirtigluma subsp. patula]